MKRSAIVLALSSLLSMTPAAGGQIDCDIALAGSVETPGPDLSLADLLAPGTCPAVLASASQMNLGKVPLAGSMRVLEGSRIRALLQRVVLSLPTGIAAISVPERITVQRRARLTCTEIAQRLVPSAACIDCAAGDRIAREAQFQITRRAWDPATKSWYYVVRCVGPGDCVPFYMRVPGVGTVTASGNPPRPEQAGADARPLVSTQEILVHRGEPATLVWDQPGIRTEVIVTCLDQGREGELVRARISRTARILRAVVVARGRLRVES